MLPELICVSAVAALITLAFAQQRRWNRLRAQLQQLEEYADSLLQHGQGSILILQGIVSAMSSDDPVRVRIEQALMRAERDLSELRETMEAHCSQQQEERIR